MAASFEPASGPMPVTAGPMEALLVLRAGQAE